MGKLIIVSNRLPVSVERKGGRLNLTASVGGLATGLGSIYRRLKSLWIGWPGIIPKTSEEKYFLEEKFREFGCKPVFLSRYSLENYYYGFSNRTIWPLFHYFPQHTVYSQTYWRTYRHVNNVFCRRVLEEAEPEDVIWIHDYHLMLLPKMLRERLPEATIGFFLHIPFPSTEIFRLLPWRREILEGMLGADLVGFHTYDYVRHFLDSVLYLLEYEHEMGWISLEDRKVRVDAFPMGIDVEKFEKALGSPEVERELQKLKRRVGGKKVIFSISRLDYTKGILEKLEAYEKLLTRRPQWLEKLVFILVCTPSRSKVFHYHLLERQVDELVGRINGKFGNPGWMPILYLYQQISFNMLTAFYRAADVAVVTPLRDGMNLVAKEFVASKTDGRGVLVLSETAGASRELGEALIINPNNREEFVQALEKALTMPEREQEARLQAMRERLRRYDVARWAEDFLEKLSEAKHAQEEFKTKSLDVEAEEKLVQDYLKSESSLFLLDYDGTLMPFAEKPEKAYPDREVRRLLRELSKCGQVVLVSGRDRKTLERWFNRKFNLVAEHGAWIKEAGKPWFKVEELDVGWKEELRPIFELFTERVPGSFTEEKEFSLVWHYRKADPVWGSLKAGELANILRTLTANTGLQVFQGSKTVEVKDMKVGKGRAVLHWLAKRKWDFILAMGDDWTDEEMFKVLPEQAYTIRIGFSPSKARFHLKSYREARRLLKGLIEASKTFKPQLLTA